MITDFGLKFHGVKRKNTFACSLREIENVMKCFSIIEVAIRTVALFQRVE